MAFKEEIGDRLNLRIKYGLNLKLESLEDLKHGWCTPNISNVV